MRVAVLGPLAMDGAEQDPSPRDRVILEALIAAHGGVLDLDQLAEALWCGSPPSSANKIVQGCVMRLRRLIGSEAIETTTHGYRWAVDGDDVDATRFERLVERGRELMALDEPARAGHVFGEALALWRGRAFDELDNWEHGRIERLRLDELRLAAEEMAIDAAISDGGAGAVVSWAHALVEQEPMRERRWALLARAEYQSGRQSDALRTLRRARARLLDEAGLDPGPELIELEAAVLRQDPTLDAVSARASDRCPFPGLAPFGMDDAEQFFGRDRIVSDCIEMLDRSGVVALVGPSGVGKSSVARAGVAAALMRSGRLVTVVTPAAGPEAVCTESSSEVAVLIVDQCEEALMVGDASFATEYFDALAERAQAGPVMFTLRADRLGPVSAHVGMARLVERGLVLLGAMTEDELRTAIDQPARQAGLLIEPGLVDILINEVVGEPGALPLLAHALRETWERREGRVMTVEGYRATGGLRGAVAASAEELYRRLAGDQQAVVRDLMLRMVVPTGEGDAVRSPVPRRLIAADHEHERIVDMLVNARLVISDGDTIGLAHEALIGAWPRLRTWLDDDRDGQRILRHMTVAAGEWASMGRSEAELYRGARLRAALEWAAASQPVLTPLEQEFLEAAQTAADRDVNLAEKRARDQIWANRRLRLALGGVAVLLLIAAAAGVVALVAARRASSQASSAEDAFARSLAARSLDAVDTDRSRALLGAIESSRLEDTVAARGALVTALLDEPMRRTSILTPATDHMAIAIDEAATVAVAKRADGRLDVVDLVDRRVRWEGLPGVASPLAGVTVDAGGRFAASSGGPTAPPRVYDITSGELVAALDSEADFQFVAFDPVGGRLALTRDGGRIAIYERGSWRETAELDTGSGELVTAIAWHPAGDRLTVATEAPMQGLSAADPARLWTFDVDDGRLVVGPVDTDEALISSIAVRPDDDELVVAGAWLQRREVTSLAAVDDPFGHSEVDGLVSVDLAADGTVYAGSPIELQVHPPDGADSTTVERGSPGVAMSADESVLVTADIDGLVSTWSLEAARDGGREVVSGEGQIAVSRDGSNLAIWQPGVRLADAVELATGRPLPLSVGRDADVLGVDFTNDGRRLATLSCVVDDDRCAATAEVWDTATGELLAGPEPVGDVWSGLHRGIAFADDESAIAIATVSGTVEMHDASTLERRQTVLRLADHTAVPGMSTWAVDATTVDGRPLVVAHDELGQSVVWDVSGTKPKVLGALENAFRMQFAPDGRLVTSSGRGALVFRDPFTLKPGFGVLGGTIPADTYAFGPDPVTGDDDMLMLASGDHGAQLWQVGTRELVTGALGAGRSAIAPDGSILYLGARSSDPSVTALPLDPVDLEHSACESAGRNLTLDEWRDFMGDEPYRATCPQWPSGA